MAWYDAGTVKVTVNSATVTGMGTKWLAGARQGEAFVAPDGRLYEVLNIASDTSLTLTKPYRGATASTQQYALAPMQGYVKELADRAADLLPVLSDIGTAAKGTLATDTTDSTLGRVARIGDWGLGANAGVSADAVVLNNTVNGFYRSGSGATAGKPVNNSGDGYIKFGWSGVYSTYLYGSPAADKLWYQHVSNGEAKGWKELMAVGQFGLGSVGAGASDSFPAANLNATGVGSGSYYYNSTIGDTSSLPFGSLTADRAGVVFHKMAGTAGGQVLVSGSGRLGWRGRNGSNYGAFKEAVAKGDFGVGGTTVTVTDSTYDRSITQLLGWPSTNRPKPGDITLPPWCVGFNMAYNATRSALLFTDTISGQVYSLSNPDGSYRDLRKMIDDKNMVGNITGGAVINSGSNGNGSWIQFADGTQVCSGAVNFPGTGWSGKNWTYPMAFATKPIVVASGEGDNGGFAAAPILNIYQDQLFFTMVSNSPENQNWGRFNCIALGRWKA